MRVTFSQPCSDNCHFASDAKINSVGTPVRDENGEAVGYIVEAHPNEAGDALEVEAELFDEFTLTTDLVF